MTFDTIRSRFYDLTKTNSTSVPNATLNRYIQPALEEAVALIDAADSAWVFDDSNYADLPIGTTNLVANQKDYSLATSHLTIDRVDLLASTGQWIELTQIDQQELKRGRKISLDTYQNSPGIPLEYDVIGNSVFLYPTPNYNQSGGLKLYFTRGPLNYDYTANSNGGQFTDGSGSGATTDAPGFNGLFHKLVYYLGAYDYVLINMPQLAVGYANKITEIKKALNDFYGLRDRDRRPRFSTSQERINYGNQSGVLGAGIVDSNR